MAARVEPVTASDAFAITPSDSTIFATIPSALYVGGAGDVIVVTEKGTQVLFTSVPAGTTIPLRVTQVKAGSDASNIVGLIY